MTAWGPDSRVAIAGAGCAGCSLACEILARCPGVRVTVYDAAEQPTGERTWCFWDIRNHRFSDAIRKRWDRLVVRSPTNTVDIDASSYPYACIRAEDFFGVAERLMSGGSCTVRRGVSVQRITEQADDVELVIRDGHGESTERFTHVFDGRPPSPATDASGEPMLLQHFGGIELDTSAAPVDPGVATLMDFGVSQEHGAHFMYVLPFRPDRVLVESTFITPSVPDGLDYESFASVYARDVLGVEPDRVVYRESGVLPMTLRPLGQPPTDRVWPIGTRAGIGRASSGYSFAAIQSDSARVVDALLAGTQRPRAPRPPLLGMLDRVLLSLLQTDPQAAPVVFTRLFRGASPQRVIRFLADAPRLLDYLAVMWAMPKWRIISHLLTHRSAWPRGV
ncbi:MAG: lycopene cyclase family protein [Planctomycetota bacterium]